MIRAIINFYILLIIIDTILSYLPEYRNKLWALRINRIANFTLNPIRKYLPANQSFDFSPLIVIIALRLLMTLW